MPKKIDDELKARAVRLVNDHQGEYCSLVAPWRCPPSTWDWITQVLGRSYTGCGSRLRAA